MEILGVFFTKSSIMSAVVSIFFDAIRESLQFRWKF